LAFHVTVRFKILKFVINLLQVDSTRIPLPTANAMQGAKNQLQKAGKIICGG
jgi:hypothetical protein